MKIGFGSWSKGDSICIPCDELTLTKNVYGNIFQRKDYPIYFDNLADLVKFYNENKDFSFKIYLDSIETYFPDVYEHYSNLWKSLCEHDDVKCPFDSDTNFEITAMSLFSDLKPVDKICINFKLRGVELEDNVSASIFLSKEKV